MNVFSFFLTSIFYFRSQTDNEGNITAESGTGGGSTSMESAPCTKTGQPILEDLSGKR